MKQSTAWENGSRVPAYDPREEDEDERRECSWQVSSPVAIMMRRLIGTMLADTHPSLGIECLALVTGIGYEGASMAEIGRRHHVTRAAVSKRCVELGEAFGIPPVRAMRPEKNRARCRMARVREMVKL